MSGLQRKVTVLSHQLRWRMRESDEESPSCGAGSNIAPSSVRSSSVEGPDGDDFQVSEVVKSHRPSRPTME